MLQIFRKVPSYDYVSGKYNQIVLNLYKDQIKVGVTVEFKEYNRFIIDFKEKSAIPSELKSLQSFSK